MSIVKRIKHKVQLFTDSIHHVGRVESFESYTPQDSNTFLYTLISRDRKSLVRPVSFWGRKNELDYSSSLPDLYQANLKHARIIGQSSVVVSQDNIILYDMLKYRSRYNANMTDDGLFMLAGFPWHVGDNFVYNYEKTEELQVLECGISFCNKMSSNYYHFFFEVASKFYTLSLSSIGKDVPLLVDKDVLNVPQLKFLVDALNIEDRRIISIEKNNCYIIENLFILSNPHIIVPNIKRKGIYLTENYAFDNLALEYVRARIKCKCGKQNADSKYERIFLSRKNCVKRSCNENELKPVLEKYGVNIIYTDNMTIRQQVEIFGTAKIVIGGTGAAFANLLFCNPGTLAVIFMPIGDNVTCFSSLASALGIKTIFLMNTDSNHSIHKSFYTISPLELDDCLFKYTR